MAGDRRPELGRLGERLAERHLTKTGYRVLDRNYRTREGEIDLIAFGGGTLVFCEVKTLAAPSGRARGPTSPFETIHPRKRRQVRRMAGAWLAERRAAGKSPRYRDIRFDAIGVVLSASGRVLSLEHLAEAF